MQHILHLAVDNVFIPLLLTVYSGSSDLFDFDVHQGIKSHFGTIDVP